MACKTISFFFFCFLFISIDSISSQQLSDTETDCSKRWIHIRRLPSRFNLDLLTNCSEYPLFDNFCPYLANHGLGPKTHNKSQSWYRSNPLLLELIFHRRMLEYPCLTSDPSQANAIYLPYYAAIDSLRYLYGPGADHFLVMSRPALDFSQSVDVNPPIWGTSFLELPEFYNLTVLIVEGRAWPWQEQASWIKRVKASKRTTLLLFAGGGGVGSSPNIRRSIRNECENSSLSNSSDVYVNNGGGHDYYKMRKVCDIVDCSNGVCEHDPVRYMRPMLRATFCLQPPGDTPTRRSTFDGIIAGCIPVFFEEQSAKSQYGWHLPEEMYRDFAVFMPKEDIVFKGLRILDVLMGIPRDEVRRMRERVIELIPRVVYRKHGSSLDLRARKDAFDIAVEGALQRIHSRLKARDFDQ
ncbi:xyloglucan galactosyltransferase GT19 [Populus alba x Populus x berolinensis]|nr:xyloglucan galactosyltransferase GT19 [Populus alba x Populus x berolinensis]